MAISKAQWKVWRATSKSNAGMMVTPDSAFVIADDQNFLAVTGDGLVASGPFSFATTSENIRVGGFFIKMPDFSQMIPSTTVTPLPSQIPFPPVSFLVTIAQSLPTLIALMAT
jgi:hypothetical protein